MKAEMTHFSRHQLLVNMPITNEHKSLIKNLFVLKGYNAKQLVREIPSKGWNVDGVYKLLQKLPITGLVNHRPAAAWCRCSAADNIDLVYELSWCYTEMAKRQIILAQCT